jgi:hypothetical protein
VLGRGRKSLLFLKKKKQKDFYSWWRVTPATTPQMDKSFLVLFFKKERAFFLRHGSW